jgi:hypothetical protein
MSLGKSAVQVVGEKENTPERVRVKEEEDEKVPSLLPVEAKAGRARKLAAAVVPRAQSELEKDVTASKTRAPRMSLPMRAASEKK